VDTFAWACVGCSGLLTGEPNIQPHDSTNQPQATCRNHHHMKGRIKAMIVGAVIITYTTFGLPYYIMFHVDTKYNTMHAAAILSFYFSTL
jgi:hypothetical protein